MSDLFSKLNLLVKSSINDVLGDESPRRRVPSRGRLGKNLDKEVAYLRERINEAIAHENTLQERVDSLMQETAALDAQADEAVKQGNEAQARHIIAQLQRTQQRLTIAESDLREHQLVTQDLIQRVNLLDAVVSEARHEGQLGEDSADASEAIDDAQRSLSDRLRVARETVTGLVADSKSAASATDLADGGTATDDSQNNDAVDDDLSARLQRLSKPK